MPLQVVLPDIRSPQRHGSDYIKTKRTIEATAISLSAIAVFSKIFGFAEKMIVAHYFGTEAQADVYFASMGIVLSVFFLVKELIYPSVLPVFAQVLKKSFSASSALFKDIFFRLFVVLLMITGIIMVFPDTMASVFVPGFSEEKKILTSSLLKYLAPGCLLLCMTTFTYAILNCRKYFLKAALSETGFKFAVAVGLVALAPFIGIHALAIVLAGAAGITFVIQLFFIPESKEIFRSRAYSSNHEFQKILTLIGPLFIGVVFSHISGLVDNMLASTLPTGHLSYLGYAKKIIDAILLIGPIALVTVVYSQLSHLALETTKEEFRKLFVRAFRLILIVSVPTAILLIVLRVPIVTILLERGRFTSNSTAGTCEVLFIYGIGLTTFSLEALIVYTFYALSKPGTPVKAGIFCVIIDIVLAVLLIQPFGFKAIAWAFVISKTIKILWLIIQMEKQFPFLYISHMGLFFMQLGGVCLVSSVILYVLANLFNSHTIVQTVLFDLAVPFAGFVSAFFIGCWICKIKELSLLRSLLTNRNARRNKFGGDNK